MAQQLDIWQILEQLNLRPTAQAEQLIRLAWQGEQHRRERLADEPEAQVSRTTLLWAATCVDDGLIGLLQESGLDYERWLDRNGLRDAPRDLEGESPSPLLFNDEVREAFEQAAKTSPDQLDVNALVVGVLSSRRGLFPKIFRDCGGRPDEARDAVAKARMAEPEAPSAPATEPRVEPDVEQVAREQAPYAVGQNKRAPLKKGAQRRAPRRPAPRKPDALPLAVNDAAGARADLLDAEEHAHLFARLAAARNLKPPIAFGLFGAWGAGKSYFMDLMEAHVAKLEKGEVSGVPASESWRGICQIRFNAWHYMDADLWASLAGTIFESIAFKLGKDTEGEKVAKRRAALKKRLRSTIEAEQEATRRETKAAAALESAHTELVEAERAFEDKRIELEARVDELVWSKLHGKATSAAFETSLQALGIHPESDGVKRLLTSTAEARRVADDARSVAGQVRGLALDVRRNPWVWVFGVAVLFFLPLGLQLLSQVHEKLAPLREGMTAGLTQIATLVGLFANRVKTVTGHVEQVLTFAQRVEAEGGKLRQQALEELLEAERESKEGVAKDYDEAATKLEVARAKVAGLRSDIHQIREELNALHAGKLVYDFVLERSATDGIYRSREGIVSIVRRDLETLGDLILQWEPPADDVEEAESAVASEQVPAPLPEPKSLDEGTLAEMRLQRIVLYIDDLDRCPPERVTEVLQAVHLLLAFDLFVVVVAVDPRWLERSLETSYDKLLGKGARGLAFVDGSHGDGFHHRAASARDYLEKIFQVPFTIPRVDENGFRNLIGEHLESYQGRAERLKREATTAADHTPAPRRSEPEAPTTRAEETKKPRKERAKMESGGDRTKAKQAEAREPGAHPSVPTGSSATLATGFVIEDDEQPFAHRLWTLFRTPRSIKRFANIYRLLRAKVPEAEYAAFVEPNPSAGHRAVFTLVAANTVCPRVTSALLRALSWPAPELVEEQRPRTWPEVVDALGDPDSPFLEALDLDAEQQAELKRLLPVLRLVVDEVPEDLGIWQHWAPRVGRFSLYWHAD